jgi:hypothetical protein
MWFLTLLMLMNAWIDQRLVLDYRLDVAGVPINIYDIGLGLGLIVSMFRRRSSPNLYPTDRVHPIFKWIMGASLLATVAGAVGVIGNGSYSREWLPPLRSFLAIPVSVYLGYVLIKNPRSALWFLYALVLAGAGVAVLNFLHFGSNASSAVNQSDLNLLRATHYETAYAGLAAELLIFTFVVGITLLPTSLAVALTGLCFIGACATLARSEWVAIAAGVCMIYRLLPKGFRWGKVVRATIFFPLLLFLFGWVGLLVGSELTGTDFFGKMADRVETLMPSSGGDMQTHAWDSRLPAARRELGLWLDNPLTGQGFGIQWAEQRRDGRMEWSFRHNAWTSVLAESGVFGFTTYALVVFGMLFVGRRMVKDQWDRESVLVGALGAMAGAHVLVWGLSTLSFNELRGAIPVGLICGVVLKARAMQLTGRRVASETEGAELVATEGAMAGEVPVAVVPEYPAGFGGW